MSALPEVSWIGEPPAIATWKMFPPCEIVPAAGAEIGVEEDGQASLERERARLIGASGLTAGGRPRTMSTLS